MSGEGCVYFIQAETGGPIKIGWSRYVPEMRILSLQIGNPEVLVVRNVLPGGSRAEAEFHARFAHLRILNEWFAPMPELAEVAKAIPGDRSDRVWQRFSGPDRESEIDRLYDRIKLVRTAIMRHRSKVLGRKNLRVCDLELHESLDPVIGGRNCGGRAGPNAAYDRLVELADDESEAA